jgi:hypothetical protein
LGADVARRLEQIKHYLWPGNVTHALEQLGSDPEFPEKPSIATERFLNGVAELHPYIRNNQNFTPNYGERYLLARREDQHDLRSVDGEPSAE